MKKKLRIPWFLGEHLLDDTNSNLGQLTNQLFQPDYAHNEHRGVVCDLSSMSDASFLRLQRAMWSCGALISLVLSSPGLVQVGSMEISCTVVEKPATSTEEGWVLDEAELR